ncbi:hypothetical protein BDV34DRAFT_217938 [Aspergillus parasiticus]|uniref:NAD-dependent epimerase/dehydratase domain-containing protein n=1 Tax=Aspergillus parasiticus TaxID=5067 RepID=A0A5N6D2T3_ASPPA|nr:hypothetical protein BDV34DRAFT_217938 [Aspergillus parasiticus]
MAKVALITGVNGITGSAILDHLVKYTTEEEWRRIIITSRTPLTLSVQDPRVELIALDFSKPVDVLAQDMSPLCTEVTHAYFSSYVRKDSFAELNAANRSLFENFLEALLLEDFLREKQRGTTWSWNVIRPEAIIGYAVKPNGMNGLVFSGVQEAGCGGSHAHELKLLE